MKKLCNVKRAIPLLMMALTMLLFPIGTFAQSNSTATGVVVDETGEPMVGVAVTIGSRGTITDVDGQFQLPNVPSGSMLTFQFLGMNTIQAEFTGTPMRIVMQDDVLVMDEVIVVGYGEQTRSSFTGAAGVVTAEQLLVKPVSNIFDALKGQVSGLNIKQLSQAPGSTPEFQVRGVGSISASASPLIVVDGAPFSGSWNSINPNDVESITVLKDAASNAIYGARGGNGVILVTTKKAQRGKASVVFDAKVGFNKMNKRDRYDIITDPREYYEAHYLAMYNYYTIDQGNSPADAHRKANYSLGYDFGTNSGLTTRENGGLGYMTYTLPENEYLIGSDGKFNPNATAGRKVTANGQDYWIQPDDWFDEGYQTGIRQDYNLSVGGGNEKIQFYGSLGYLNETGVVPSSSFERFSTRLKATYEAKEWLRVGANINIAQSERNSASGITSTIDDIAPIYPLYLRDGNGNFMQDDFGKRYDYGGGENAGLERPVRRTQNALQTNTLNTNRSNTMTVNANGFADFIFNENWKFTLNGTLASADSRTVLARQPFYYPSTIGGAVVVAHSRRVEVNTQQILRYNKFINGHSINAFIAHEFTDRNTNGLEGQRTNLYNYFGNQELAGAINIQNTDDANTTDSNWSEANRYLNQSFFAQAQYDYRGRYFFSGSFRREASSRFHPDHWWGNFWSVGGAWIISNEKWFTPSWVDMLKLRMSYGQQGNDNIGDGRYEDRYTLVNSNGQPSFLADRKGVKNVTWETNNSFSVAAEFELLKGRLHGSVDLFNRLSTDVLLSIAIPISSGYNDYTGNAGAILNQGVEVELGGDIIRKRNFVWSASLNATMQRNEIKELPAARKTQAVNGEYVGWYSSSRLTAVGYSRYTMYMPTFAGINSSGQALFYLRDSETDAVTGTTTIRGSAREYIAGDVLPLAYGGFSTSVRWRSFDLSMGFAYQIGGKAYDATYASLMTAPRSTSVGSNIHKDYKKSWTVENPNNEFPIWKYKTDTDQFTGTNSRWVTDASFLSFHNLAVGYSIPSKIAKRLFVESIRLSFTVDNLAYLSARKGFHPDTGFDWDGGEASSSYPRHRTYTAGLNVKF